jgi:hypothetical protein
MERTGCERLVVVNVATTEAPLAEPLPETPDALRDAIAGGASSPRACSTPTPPWTWAPPT